MINIKQTKKTSSTKCKTTWTNVKNQIKDMSSRDLISLIQELYSVSKDCKTFLNTRFCENESSLENVKELISRFVNPDLDNRQSRVSFVDAKKAISTYAHASNQLYNITELRVYMCEQCAQFVETYGVEYEDYYDSWANAIKAALADINKLPIDLQVPFVERMVDVYYVTKRCGYGIEDIVAWNFKEYGFFDE